MADVIELSQAKCLLKLHKTALPDDLLLAHSFAGSESISGLFKFSIDALTQRHKASQVQADKMVGSPVTLSVALTEDFENGQRRHFHGVVSRFAEGRYDERFVHYHMEVVPWLWLLSQSSDCRIFQDQSVPDIIEKVFNEWKDQYGDLVQFRKALSDRDYTPWDYCVQYRETDFNFVSRMMEQEGISYYFEHEEDKHTLVLVDTADNLNPSPHHPTVPFKQADSAGQREPNVFSLRLDHELRPGKVTLRDHH